MTTVLLCAAQTLAAQMLPARTSIVGTVTDAATGQPVVGATILVSGTTQGTASGPDGSYALRGLATGSYTLDVSMIAYEPQRIEVVGAAAGEVRIDIALREQSEQIGDVVVTAVRRTGSEVAVNRDVREAMTVMSGVSGQTIRKTQDRDAGEVVRRIPGISLVDDKFIIARGLSQRYNNVWVNGAAVPSSEADSRAFSFDIIPAGQIEKIGRAHV